MVYWKLSQPHSGPRSLTVSFMEWHSHAVNDQRHSRVHDCCVTQHFKGGCRQEAQRAGPSHRSECRGTTPPGMWPCSKAGLPPHPHHRACWGQELDRLEGRLYFQGMTNWLCWLGESSYQPPAPAPRTTCREDLFRGNLYEEVSQQWEPKQPATKDDCNPGSMFLQPSCC